MRDKGFSTFLTLVIITALVGCDNVAFGGIQVSLRPPSTPEDAGPDEGDMEPEEPAIEPLDLGPLLYFVQRLEGSTAVLVPVAALAEGAYEGLPDPAESPEVAERFPVARYEPGAEFTLYAQGVRAGTFVSDGTVELDTSMCLARSNAHGRIEILPEAAAQQRYLAVAHADALGSSTLRATALGEYQARVEDSPLRAAASQLAQRLIQEMDIPVPPSIPDTRRDLQPLTLATGGARALGASFVYGDGLVVGPSTPLAYSLFFLAEEREARYEPVFAWYHRFDAGGKAFPRLLGAHDLMGVGAPDALFEVFGETSRWMAVLGERNGAYRLLYQDACGVPLSDGGVRTFP